MRRIEDGVSPQTDPEVLRLERQVERLRERLEAVTELCLEMLYYARDWDWKYDFTGQARELGLISYEGVTTIEEARAEWNRLGPEASLAAQHLLNVWPDAAKEPKP